MGEVFFGTGDFTRVGGGGAEGGTEELGGGGGGLDGLGFLEVVVGFEGLAGLFGGFGESVVHGLDRLDELFETYATVIVFIESAENSDKEIFSRLLAVAFEEVLEVVIINESGFVNVDRVEGIIGGVIIFTSQGNLSIIKISIESDFSKKLFSRVSIYLAISLARAYSTS